MGKKLRKDLEARRTKARAASARQARARTEVLSEARNLLLSVLGSLNDECRAPEVALQARARRGVLPIPGLQWSPEEEREVAADQAAGIATTRKLLAHWDHDLVVKLMERVVVKGAEYVISPVGSVELQPRLSTGPAEALAALLLAQARHLLRSVDGPRDPFKRRVKKCANPTCEKWFFDAERGMRTWCCVPCGNAHRQLQLSDSYEKRLKAGEYARRRSPCSRPDCEG